LTSDNTTDQAAVPSTIITILDFNVNGQFSALIPKPHTNLWGIQTNFIDWMQFMSS